MVRARVSIRVRVWVRFRVSVRVRAATALSIGFYHNYANTGWCRLVVRVRGSG